MPTIKPAHSKQITPVSVGATPASPEKSVFRSREVRQVTNPEAVIQSRSPHDALPELPLQKTGRLRKARESFSRIFSPKTKATRESPYATVDEARVATGLQKQGEAIYENLQQARRGTRQATAQDEGEYVEMSAVGQEPEYVEMGEGARVENQAENRIYEDPDAVAGRPTQHGTRQATAQDEGEYVEMAAVEQEPEYVEMGEGARVAHQAENRIYEDPDAVAGRPTQHGTRQATAQDEGEYVEMSAVEQEPEYVEMGEGARVENQAENRIYEDPDAVAGRPTQHGTRQATAQDEGEYVEMAAVEQEPEYVEMGEGARVAHQAENRIYEDPDAVAGRPTQHGTRQATAQDEGEYVEMAAVEQEPEYVEMGEGARVENQAENRIYEDPDAVAGRPTQHGTRQATAQDEGEYVEMSAVEQEPEYAEAGEGARVENQAENRIYEDPDAVAGRSGDAGNVPEPGSTGRK